jgi:hypothetical protein
MNTDLQNDPNLAQIRKIDLLKKISIIVLIFSIGRFPLNLANFIDTLCDGCIRVETFYILLVFYHINSAVNPILYAYHLVDFRKAIFKLFRYKRSELP